MIFRLRLAAVFFALITALSACQTSSSATPTPTIPLPQASAEATEVVEALPEWIEEQANGVEIGMWKPNGWSLDSTVGVTLLQHNPSLIQGQTSPESGIIVNIFSPNLDHLGVPESPADTNHALWVLEHVVSTPGMISSNSVASTPQPFMWNGHEAAFYLLTGVHNKRAIVICVAVGQMICINISMPHQMAEAARQSISQLFSDFTAAGVQLGSEDLAMLPDPLVFPERDAERTPEQYGG